MSDEATYMAQELNKLREDRKIMTEALKKYAKDWQAQMEMMKAGGGSVKISYDMGATAYEALYKAGEKLDP